MQIGLLLAGSFVGLILAHALTPGCAIRRPISEARQLYCAHCHSSCNPDQSNVRAANNVLASESHDRDGSESTSLVCKCESVFDIKRGSFTCKNTSQTEAKVNRRPKANGGASLRLETSAFARSQLAA